MDAVSLIAPMLGVVGVIILAYLATKWLAGRNAFRPSDGKRIRILERVPLGRDTYLALVRVNRRTYLLSVAPGRVEQIGDPDGASQGSPNDRAHQEDFESLLNQRMRKLRDQPPEVRMRSGARR
jgi:flagellar biogenesis protein FliO